MKKLIALILLSICMINLIACDIKFGKEAEDTETHSFQARVLEVDDNYLLVEPLPDSNERRSADKIQISLQNKTESWHSPKVGDLIKIVYDGVIMESYPARIAKVYQIEILN